MNIKYIFNTSPGLTGKVGDIEETDQLVYKIIKFQKIGNFKK